MTSNQIEFAKHQENQRHNLATEDLERGKLTVERDKLTETGRHNLAGEKISAGSLSESQRHNLVSERLTQDQIINNYNLGLRQAAAAEKQANAAINSAQASMAHAGAAYRSADAAMRQAQNTALSISETSRHNKAMESITDVFNHGTISVKEDQNTETKRHNKINEVLGFTDSALDFAGNVLKGLKW